MEQEQININGIEFRGIRLKTQHGTILLVQGAKANLGCGYFSIAPADQLGDRFAIVTGVKCFEDMLQANIHTETIRKRYVTDPWRKGGRSEDDIWWKRGGRMPKIEAAVSTWS